MSDLISRQAAIEIIKNYCENGCDIAEDNWCPSCQREKFVELLKALPSAQQWIPCSDRLPENEDIYFVTFDKSNLLDNETQVSDAYWINNQWQYGVLESYEHRMPKLVIEPIEELKVIAWMPLPEPYKGEET